MSIYEPVTNIGKAVAKALTKDDGIRLDVHDILEKWEPEYIAEKEKAEKWDQYAIYNNDKEAEIPVKDLITAYEKLEAVKDWWFLFNQCIDSEAVKEKLEEILEVGE